MKVIICILQLYIFLGGKKKKKHKKKVSLFNFAVVTPTEFPISLYLTSLYYITKSGSRKIKQCNNFPSS